MGDASHPREFSGAMTALVTPFDERGAVDMDRFRRLLRFQADNGIAAVVVAGTTGEGPTLERAELLDLVEVAVDTVGDRVAVIAGCGTNDTARAVRMTREVGERGAAAGLSVVPYYNRPSQEGLFRHFMTIADEGGIPILLYNVPGRTGANLLPETVARLAEHPEVVGIKEASGDLGQVEEILAGCPPGFCVLSGEDGLTFAIMALGGRGVISVTSNILPAKVSRMVNALTATRWEEAMELHRALSPIHRALFIDTNPVPVKEAFRILGFPVGSPRLPLVPLDPERRATLEAVLESCAADFRMGPRPAGEE
jgi:4-hydroxy-tetrahydrodipicolinate synthase